MSLAFQPTAIVGLNKDLEMPVVSFKSAAKPSMYGYTPMLEEKKKETGEKVATAVLSITNKQKKKEAEKKKTEKMDVDEKEDKDDKKMEVDDKKKDDVDEKKPEKKAEEATFEILPNPARVMKAQLRVCSVVDAKYSPMKNVSIGGVVMLNNVTGEKEEIVEPMAVNKVRTGHAASRVAGAVSLGSFRNL